MNQQQFWRITPTLLFASFIGLQGSHAHAEDVEPQKYAALASFDAQKWDIKIPVRLGARYEQASKLLLDRDNFALESSYADVLARIGLSIDANDALLPFLLKAEFEADVVSGAFDYPDADVGFGLSGSEALRSPDENFVNDMLRKAYLRASLMQYAHIMAGVMTSHWGLGLVANDGAHGWTPKSAKFHDPRGGDRVLRAMLASGPHMKRHQIFAAVGFDQLLNDDAMLDGDEGNQIVAALVYGRDRPNNAGVYFVRRHQVNPGQTLQTTEQGFDINLSEGVTDVNVIDATFNLHFDLGESIGQLKLAGEAAYITGESSLAPNPSTSKRTVQQLGIAARASLDRSNHGLILDFLLASGDGDLNDNYQAAFKADRNYSMGLLMYRHLMAGHTGRAPITASNPDIVGVAPQDVERFATRGSASNTIAFFPRAYWQVLESAKDDIGDLEVYGGPLVAFTATPLLDPFNTKIQGGAPHNALNAEPGNYLGTEIDVGVRFRKLLDTTELTVGAEVGYLIPGDAFTSATGEEQGNVFGGRAILEYRL